MGYLRFALVTINALAFAALLGLSVRFMRREPSQRVRRLWMVVSLISGALIIGSLQRLVLQGATLGWLSQSATTGVIEGWQVVQSLMVVALALTAFATVKRVAVSMSTSERIAGSMLDRVGHVDLDRIDLTRREHEVLAAIGSGLLTDAELAEDLHISPNTVQTHVKRLLRKTGLNRRQDLIAVAFLMETSRL